MHTANNSMYFVRAAAVRTKSRKCKNVIQQAAGQSVSHRHRHRHLHLLYRAGPAVAVQPKIGAQEETEHVSGHSQTPSVKL